MPKGHGDTPITPGHPRYGADHFEKFGRFIAQFARTEIEFHMAFRFYSQMPISESRLLFGGARTVDVIEHTKRLMKLHRVTELLRDDFAELATHFKTIADVRNKLIHYQFLFLRRDFQIFDIASAKIADDAFMISVSIEELTDMEADLKSIALRLHFNHVITDTDVDTSFSWRYKPSSLRRILARHQ